MKTKEKVIEIARAVRQAGGRAILVGGCVRDELLGIPVKDYDMEIYALTAAELYSAIAGICEVEPVGMSFGVLKVRHYDIDLALPRRDNKTGAGHRGFLVEIDPEMDFASAASRRDFTVNAIMQDALTGEIIDPYDGRKDLEKKILRHVSPAFSEDPLRVLRGMQFISRFDLIPAAETVKLCAELSQNELASERIASEWEKLLLKGKNISAAMKFLRDTGWVNFYPPLAALINCPQNPQWHPEGDVWNHTLAVMDAAVKLRPANDDDALIFMLAALCHDFGKPLCTVTGADGRITSCGHDTLTEPAEKFITSIWMRRDLPERVLPLISRHMHPWQLAADNSSDKAFRKLALYAKRLDLLADLAEADVRGIIMNENELDFRLTKIALFRSRCEKLAIADRTPEPLLLGRHLIARGLKPGSSFAPILAECFEAQLAGEFTDIAGALKYLDKLLCGK